MALCAVCDAETSELLMKRSIVAGPPNFMRQFP